MRCHILDDEDPEYVSAWFEHYYSWNRLLASAGYIDYKFMNLEEKRVRTYAALLMLADGCWATAEDVSDASELGNGDMESALIGLSYLREVEVEMNDNGDMIYQLTKFGKAWASALVAEYEDM